MFNHIVIGTNNIERAQKFYDAVLATLNIENAVINILPEGPRRLFYRRDGMSFVVTEPLNGEPATVANGSTIAFRCDSSDQVQQFHKAAVENGGLSIEDAPGWRMRPAVGEVFLAYVRDPDGNKLCATYRTAPAS